MFVTRRVRPFVYFFLLLITSLLLTFTFARTGISYSAEELIGGNIPQYQTAEEGEWIEMGSGSASGKGISKTSVFSMNPSLAIASDGTPVVAWRDDAGGNAEIYVRRWNGLSWEEMGNGSASGAGISDTSTLSLSPSLAISPGSFPIIAWADANDIGGSQEIYVRRWNGSSWVEMGTASASGGGISNSMKSSRPSLAISPDGTPIIAWADSTSGNYEIYVRRWNGSSWVEMGSGSASGGGISESSGYSSEPSLAIRPNGTPIITWADSTSGGFEIYVRRWLADVTDFRLFLPSVLAKE